MSLETGWMGRKQRPALCLQRRYNRSGAIAAAALLAILVPCLANAYCGVRIQGKWQYSGGHCKDWNDYADSHTDPGFACFDFGSVALSGNGKLLRKSATDVSLVPPSGQEMPLASDAMQRTFDAVAPQALASRPFQRIIIPDDHGVISDQRLAQISRETGLKLVDAAKPSPVPQPIRVPPPAKHK